MLILIAGVTGNIGQHTAVHALSQDHQVRGLGRSPTKLPRAIHSQLESFVTSSSYWDVAALEAACDGGVDAVICAYAGLPELHLDAQLLLLRAAERAGVRRFLAAGWNYDWRTIGFGDEPVYDATMAFHAQVELSSGIRPCHVFSGMLVDVFFGEFFGPELGGVWDGKAGRGRKNMDIWGTGDEVWNFTTEEDAGKWGVEVITADGAEEGGFFSVCSFSCGLNEVKDTYERVRGEEVEVRRRGAVEELETIAVAKKGNRRDFWDWHRFWFHLFCVRGTWNLKDLQNGRFSKFKPTSLRQYLESHPNV